VVAELLVLFLERAKQKAHARSSDRRTAFIASDQGPAVVRTGFDAPCSNARHPDLRDSIHGRR
jgi:hypothetical protein